MKTKLKRICFTGKRKPIKWSTFVKLCFKYMRKHPCCDVTWYPDGTITSSAFVNNVNRWLLHWLPAYVIDALTWTIGGRPM